MAQRKATTLTVKSTAEKIHADHVRANTALKVLASQKGWDLPNSPGSEAEATRARLDKLIGAAFDKAYVEALVVDHQNDIEVFEVEAAEGRDAAMRRFATETLPNLKVHLTMALRTGTVWINGSTDAMPELPLGGRRDSGYGAEFGREGLEVFTSLKTVQVRRGASAPWYAR